MIINEFNQYRSRWFQRSLILMFISGFVLAGCAQIRLLTYPKEFNWIDPADVKSVMHAMALSINRLHVLATPQSTEAGSDSSIELQSSILEELTLLDELATSVSNGRNDMLHDELSGPATNHLLIDEHIDEFISRIQRARWLAEAEPPNYYAVGQLTGNCNACHRMR